MKRLLGNWKIWLVLGILAFVGVCLTGCGGGRTCLRSHTEMRWMPITQYNPATKGVTTTMMWYPAKVCDEYAQEGSR